MKTTFKLLSSYFVLITSLSAYEIIIDKTLKEKKVKTSTNYTYPPLERDDIKQIVYDPATKLIWQDNSEAKNTKKDWEVAKRYCSNLSHAGYSDWRLPSIKELESLADYSRFPNAYKKGFKNFTSSDYWSSSPYASHGSDAWYVYFKYGGSFFNFKTVKNYVRCARGGQ